MGIEEESVRVSGEVLDRLLAEARLQAAIECCGFLAGRDRVISMILPARNVLESATSYEIAPQELFLLFRRIRESGFEHLGIYHSHPDSENVPSPRDIDRAFYPRTACFILSPRRDAPRPIRAFRIVEGRVHELRIERI